MGVLDPDRSLQSPKRPFSHPKRSISLSNRFVSNFIFSYPCFCGRQKSSDSSNIYHNFIISNLTSEVVWLLQNLPKMTKLVFSKRKCSSMFFFRVEKLKVANCLKRVLTKFRANRGHVRGVNVVRPCTTLYDMIRRCTTLYAVVRRCAPLYDCFILIFALRYP